MRNYILAGQPNSGKTAIARQIFTRLGLNTDDVLDDVLVVGDTPDATHLIKLPFGSGGLSLFDTPGLSPDCNTARVALGLAQVGTPAERIDSLSVLTLGRADENDIADVERDDNFPIADLDAYLHRDDLGCIYVLNASETPFEVGEIDALRALYQEDRFFLVVTHLDVIEQWHDKKKSQRYERINQITGKQYIPVDGETGEGIDDLIATLVGNPGNPHLTQPEFLELSKNVEDVIHSYADREALDPFLILKDIENDSLVFHLLDRPIYAIIAGRTNAGKTSFARKIFSDIALKIRYGDDVLKARDMPDVTQSLIKLPFGRREGGQEGLTLFDTPGLSADSIELRNTAHVALGLPQMGSPAERTGSLSVLTLGRADKDDIADVERDDNFPIADLDAYLHRDDLNCIYVLKASETPFEVEVIKSQIDALRALYQEDRFLIVVTHLDVIETWHDRDKKRRRYELINQITSGKYIPVNGKTGEGVLHFGHEFFINRNNYSADELVMYMKTAYRGARIFEASHHVSDILIAAFFSADLREQPDELLYPSLQLVVELALEKIYGDSDDSETSVTEDVKQIVNDFVRMITLWTTVKRKPIGFKEWVKNTFTRWYPTSTIEISGSVMKDSIAVLAYLYYILYAQIYKRETTGPDELSYKPETGEILQPEKTTAITRTAITGKIVPEKTAIDWFTAEFAPYKALIEDPENAWIFYRIVGSVLARFWQVHHPEVLPIA